MSQEKAWQRPRNRAGAGARAAAASLARLTPRRGLARARSTLVFAFQAALSAGLAYWVAVDVIGHESAFFAPIAGVISLGLSGGKRIRRGFEIVLGASVGIGIGDLVVSRIGNGPWQIGVVVFAAILLAVLVDRGPLVPTQAASSAVLVATLIPPGDQGALDRVVDALVGGLIGLVVLAVVPKNPLRAVRQEMSGLIAKASLILDDVADGMEDNDPALINDALETARGTQTSINEMLAAMSGGEEVVNLSPIYWSVRRYAKSINRSLAPVDNIMRNTRVLARRAEIMVHDGIVSTPELIRLVRELSDALGHLATLHAEGGAKFTNQELLELPEVTRRLQGLAGQADVELARGTGLSGRVVLAQCRSIIVDALQVCGMSRESAMAALKPTVENPWQPPEVWGGP